MCCTHGNSSPLPERCVVSRGRPAADDRRRPRSRHGSYLGKSHRTIVRSQFVLVAFEREFFACPKGCRRCSFFSVDGIAASFKGYRTNNGTYRNSTSKRKLVCANLWNSHKITDTLLGNRFHFSVIYWPS